MYPYHIPKFGIIIRFYTPQLNLLLSLLYNIKAQMEALPNQDRNWYDNLNILIIPTEYDAIDTLNSIKPLLNDLHVNILDIKKDTYQSLPFFDVPCDMLKQDEESMILWERNVLNDICNYNNFGHYWLTDKGIEHILNTCKDCTHFIITNGDNQYHPKLFEKIIDLKEYHFLILTFIHRMRLKIPEIRLGHIDLGSFILRRDILDDYSIRFLSSLPNYSKDPKILHDADYYFINFIKDLPGVTYKIVDEVLFYHN